MAQTEPDHRSNQSREPPVDEGELRALAVAFQRGDQRSFRVLVDTLSRTLLAAGYRHTGDWEWARDLTQETWIKVYDRIGQYDPERRFSSWLHTIHRNHCMDHLRRPWVRREMTPGDDTVSRLAGAATDDPGREVERREFHERLLVALRELSESQRQVFLRVDLEQNDQKEVARALGIKAGTLRATLHYARKRLAAALRQMEEST
ncbi:RNA polymerase sigma factor [Gemmatimonadota bacterium]